MKANFHERYAEGEIKPPSERSTGLLFAVVAVIVAIVWRDSPTMLWTSLCIAAVLAAISFAAPALLTPINILWFKIGLLLHHLVSPIVMFVMFAVIFVPAGAILRLRRDPLRRRRMPEASTYWIKRKETAKESMRNQF